MAEIQRGFVPWEGAPGARGTWWRQITRVFFRPKRLSFQTAPGKAPLQTQARGWFCTCSNRRQAWVLCSFFPISKMVKIPWKVENMLLGNTYGSGRVCEAEELTRTISRYRSRDGILMARAVKQLNFDYITLNALLASLIRYLLMNPLKRQGPFSFVGKHHAAFWTTLSRKVVLSVACDLVVNIFKLPWLPIVSFLTISQKHLSQA